VELDAQQAAARDRRDEAAAVLGLGERLRARGRGADVRVDEVEVGAVGDAVERRVLVAALDLVPADVRERRGVNETDRAAVEDAERLRAVLVAAVEQELEAEADPEERTPGRDPVVDRPGQPACPEPARS